MAEDHHDDTGYVTGRHSGEGGDLENCSDLSNPSCRGNIGLHCLHCCSLRAYLPPSQLDHAECEVIFHRPCAQCSRSAFRNLDEGLLCPHCSHLNPRHWIFCSVRDYYFGDFVSLGSSADVLERAQRFPQCSLCRLVAAVVSKFPQHVARAAIAVLSREWENDFQRELLVELRSRCASCAEPCSHQERVASTRIVVHDCMAMPLSHPLFQIAGVVLSAAGPRVATFATPPESPVTMQRIDWALIKRFIGQCHSGHPDCAPAGASVYPDAFRVVDVDERRVVRGCPSGRFVAMSYVWGTRIDSGKLMATKSSIGLLETRGSLRDSDLPATIWDAMLACKMLGERYLWVDSLCIVQDDFDEKKEQIDAMAEVYKNSIFTLVITTGRSMYESVPGISVDRTGKLRTNLQGMSFVEPEEIDNSAPDRIVAHSVWSKRGWTYQERILPTRKLYLSDNDAFFECKSQVQYDRLGRIEDEQSDLTHRVEKSDVTFGSMPRLSRFHKFRNYLRTYLQLTLTNQSDIFNAFAGILQALYGDQSNSAFGIPLPELDVALLWVPDGDSPEEERCLQVREVEDITIPSWSWASIKGFQDMSFNIASFAGTLVTWFQLDEAQTSLRRIEPGGELEGGEWGEDTFHQKVLYMALAWDMGCCEWDTPIHARYPASPFRDIASAAAARWPSYHDYLQEMAVRATKPPLSRYQALRAAVADRNRGQESIGDRWRAVLWCRAQSAFFDVTKTDEGGHLVIRNERHEHAGLFCFEDGEPGVHTVMFRLAAGERRIRCEFIALSLLADSLRLRSDKVISRLYDRELDHAELITRIGSSATPLDCEDKPLRCIPVVNAMLIGRDEDGFAFRIGLAEIFLTKWIEAERRFEDIALR